MQNTSAYEEKRSSCKRLHEYWGMALLPFQKQINVNFFPFSNKNIAKPMLCHSPQCYHCLFICLILCFFAFLVLWSFFGPLVFYVFGPVDLVYRPSSSHTTETNLSHHHRRFCNPSTTEHVTSLPTRPPGVLLPVKTIGIFLDNKDTITFTFNTFGNGSHGGKRALMRH